MIKLNIQRFGNKANVLGSKEVVVGGVKLEATGTPVDNSIFGAMKNQEAYNKGLQTLSNIGQGLLSDSQLKTTVKGVNDLSDAIEKSNKEVDKFIKKSAFYSNMQVDLQHLTRAFDKLQQIQDSGTATVEEYADAISDLLETQTRVNAESEKLNTIRDKGIRSIETFRKEIKLAKEDVNETVSVESNAIKNLKSDLLDLGKNAKTVGAAVADNLKTISSTWQEIRQTLSLEKLANGIGQSANVQLQTQLQQAYGLSGSQFNSLKSTMYGSIDTSMYSSAQVKAAMGSLQEIGVTLKDVPKYFETIIQGQAALGMTASTQAALMELSNKTGRDELTLGTQTFAKYLKSIDNLSRSQLNELVTLNANYQSEAASLGVGSEAFSETTNAVSAALAKATGDTALSSLYQQSSLSLMSSTDLVASQLGLDLGSYKRLTESGSSLFDILGSSGGLASAYYRNLMNNYDTVMGNQDLYASGIDSSLVKLINESVTLMKSGKLTGDLVDEFRGITDEALEEELAVYKENLSTAEQAKNFLQNLSDEIIDWHLMDEFTNMEQLIENGFYIVSGLLTTIAGISGVQSLSSLAKTAGGSKFLGGMSGLKSAGLIGATVYSVGSMVNDASTMQGSTGKGAGWDAARGVFLGQGSTNKTTGENALSVAGNTAKWAAAGAVIGSVIPGLGTLAGGIIGGVAGLGAGLIGANLENKKAQKEQQEALDKITENTKTTAEQTKLLNNNVSNRGYVSAVAMGGDEYGYSTSKTYSHTPKPSLPWGSITSWYGTRTNPITGAKGSFHSGIDIGVKAGTPLGAAYDGTVVGKGKNSSMGNWISIQDAKGMTHTYMHMNDTAIPDEGEYVSQGQLVGYVGYTGSVSPSGPAGAHLHYSVNSGSGYNRTTTVDPYEYMLSSGIFGGTSVSSSVSSSSSSSGRSSMMDKVSQLIQMDAVGGDNGNPVVNSIQDLKQTIIDLSNRTTANEKLMKSIAGTYVRSPRVG